MSDAEAATPGEVIDSSEGLPVAPAAPRPTRVRALVFALACSISFILYLHRYTWGFIKPDLRAEFGWDPITLGWLDSLFVLSYGMGQVPSGMLCDWFGAHLLLGGSVLLWSLALLAWAAVTSFATMAAARLVFGVAQAGAYPILNKVSKNWFPTAQRTTAQGWIATFCGRAGGAAAFFLFGTVLLGLCGLSWRWAVGVFTAVGLACGVSFLALFRNTPGEHPWANAAEAELITRGDVQAAYATRSRVRWGALLGSLTVWLLFLRALTSNMADVLFVYWFPMFLRREKDVTAAAAGWMAALPVLGGALGGVASGMLQSRLLRRASRRWVRAGVAMTGKGLAAALIFASLGVASPAALVAVLMVAKFFTDWEQPAEWGTVSDIAGRNAATVFACVNTVGALGGTLAGPLTGYVLEHHAGAGGSPSRGWAALFVLIGFETVLSAGSWLFIDCRNPLDPAPEEVCS
jgi:sugar phosphate permease